MFTMENLNAYLEQLHASDKQERFTGIVAGKVLCNTRDCKSTIGTKHNAVALEDCSDEHTYCYIPVLGDCGALGESSHCVVGDCGVIKQIVVGDCGDKQIEDLRQHRTKDVRSRGRRCKIELWYNR